MNNSFINKKAMHITNPPNINTMHKTMYLDKHFT